jgi:hypothetical protein
MAGKTQFVARNDARAADVETFRGSERPGDVASIVEDDECVAVLEDDRVTLLCGSGRRYVKVDSRHAKARTLASIPASSS